MPAKILSQNKVHEPRWFLISWHPGDSSAAAPAATKTGGELVQRLRARRLDHQGREIRSVELVSTTGAATAQQPAGAPVVAGGNRPWTDFVAIVTSGYAMANSQGPEDTEAAPPAAVPVGDFALAIAQLTAADSGGDQRLWAAIVERGDWRGLWVAGGPLGGVEGLRVLLNRLDAEPPPPAGQSLDFELRQQRIKVEVIATTPAATFQGHIAAAEEQLRDLARFGRGAASP